MTDYTPVDTTPPHNPNKSSQSPTLTQKITRPRTMLTLVGLVSVFIIGFGVLTALVQQSEQSMDTRSQAAAPTAKNIFFGDTTLFDVLAPVAVPINIDAGRSMSAVSFALDYTTADVSSVLFVLNNPSSSQLYPLIKDVGGGKKTAYYMITTVPAGPFLSGNLGNLRVTFTPEFVARTYATTNISFTPNAASGLPNQAVPVGSTSEIFSLTPGAPLALRTGGGGPTPTVNPSITPPAGIDNPGRLWYCPDLNCADAGTTLPLWVAVDSAQATITVPASAKLLRYNVTAVVPPVATGWQPMMRTEVPGRPVAFVDNGPIAYAGTAQLPLLDTEWPVTMSANVKKTVGSNPTMVYNCSTRPITGSNKKEYAYYRSGDPEHQYLIPGGCTNQTRIVVQRAGATATSPTPSRPPTVTPTRPPGSTPIPTRVPTATPTRPPGSTPTPTATPVPAAYGVAPVLSKVDLWHFNSSGTQSSVGQNNVIYCAGCRFETSFNGGGSNYFTAGWTPTVVVKVDGVEKARVDLPANTTKLLFPYSDSTKPYFVTAPTASQTHTFSYFVILKKTVTTPSGQVVFTCKSDGSIWQNVAGQPQTQTKIPGAACKNVPERIVTLVRP